MIKQYVTLLFYTTTKICLITVPTTGKVGLLHTRFIKSELEILKIWFNGTARVNFDLYKLHR
jgi:hypothetical protein